MSDRLVALLFFIAAGSAVPLSAEGLDLQEGQWETTVRVTVNGIRFPTPFTTEKCVTAADVIPNSLDDDAQCEIGDIGIDGNDVSWSVYCEDTKGSLHGHGVITYFGDKLRGAMEMVARDLEGNVVSKSIYEMRGEHTGDCESAAGGIGE